MRLPFAFVICLLSLNLHAQLLIPLTEHDANGISNYQQVKPGDTVYIQSGDRAELLIRNFHGTPDNPIIFAPLSGTNPVVIRSNNSYGISIRHCSYIRLTGWQGTHDKYGIQVLELTNDSAAGVSASNNSTDVELDHLEIAHTGFAGIMAKTEPQCDDPLTLRPGGFIQRNTWIHHCFIHDTGGEGIYVGSTKFLGQQLQDCGLVFPTVLEGVKVYENRIERTGWDGIQVSSAISDCKIYDNTLIDCSTEQYESQMSGIIIGGGTLSDCYNNLIKDCYGTGILVFGDGGTRVFNNLIIRPAKRYAPNDATKREHGIYLNDMTLNHKTYYGVFNNTIVQPKSDCIRVSSSIDFELRIYNNILLDPGAWSVYEEDNTDRTGNDSYIFDEGQSDSIKRAANATLRYIYQGRFVDAESDNYHLASNSNYIDAGRDLSDQGSVNFDFDGKIRPVGNGWDIGAYEYYEGSGISDNFEDMNGFEAIFHYLGNNQVTINLHVEKPEFVNVKLISLDGRLVMQENMMFLDAGEKIINLSNMKSGVFVLSVQAKDWMQSKKLLVY